METRCQERSRPGAVAAALLLGSLLMGSAALATEEVQLALPASQDPTDSVHSDLQKVVVLAWRFGEPAHAGDAAQRAGSETRSAAQAAAPAATDGTLMITFGNGQHGRVPGLREACSTSNRLGRVLFSPPAPSDLRYELQGVAVRCRQRRSAGARVEEVTFHYEKVRTLPTAQRMKGDFTRGHTPDR